MNREGFYHNNNVLKNDLNMGYNKDKFVLKQQSSGEWEKEELIRTGIGFRTMRTQFELCNAFSNAGFLVTMFLSDGESYGTTNDVNHKLITFLTKSNCYNMEKINFGSLTNKSFNLMLLHSSSGKKLAQICIPILKWGQVMSGSVSCTGFNVTNKTLLLINQGLNKI
jgi:hypothetical protein